MRIINDITTTGNRGQDLPAEWFDGQARELDLNDGKALGYASLRGVRNKFRKQGADMADVQTTKTRMVGDGDAAVLQVQATRVGQQAAATAEAPAADDSATTA